jgi:hypothetical protein
MSLELEDVKPARAAAVMDTNQQSGSSVVAKYAFTATSPDEISIAVGDVLVVNGSQHGIEPGYMAGRLPDGQRHVNAYSSIVTRKC